MRYVQLDDNDVVVAVYSKPAEGLIEAEDHVCSGMLYDGEVFSNPKPVPSTIQEQIEALEAQQTPRLMREALAGDSYALSKMSEIDASIAALRDRL